MGGYHTNWTVVYNFRLTVVKNKTKTKKHKNVSLIQLITIRDAASDLFDKIKPNAILME